MSAAATDPGWHLIAWLFSYPDPCAPPPVFPDHCARSVRERVLALQKVERVRLQNEYTRLFINAMPQLPCAPYGSVYLEGCVMGRSTVEIADIYRAHGLEVVDGELADHIAVECQFLGWLWEKTNRSDAARIDYEKVVAHARRWVPTFLAGVKQHDRLSWFAQAADLAAELMLAAQSPSSKFTIRSASLSTFNST